MALPAYLEYAYRWLLFKDTKGLLKQERARFNAAGDHFVGYPYVDHEAGYSMHVHAFCQVPLMRPVKITADLLAQKQMLVLRYDLLVKCEFRELEPADRARLGLPARPDHIQNHERPEVEPLRSIDFLHPLRALVFPTIFDSLWP
ncbi:MAG: hypothetical protein IPK19_18520 [Chloroflexi bacterium]|nr:hypothetical protein [Chloroflexota bacterium]